MIGKFVDSGTGLNDVALNMSPYYRLNFYFSIALVAFMLIMFRLLIPAYGIYGAAWVFTAALVIYNLLKTYFVWRRMRLQPFSAGSLRTLFIGAATAALVWLVPTLSNPYWDTLLRSSLIFIIFAGLVLWLRPSADISHYIHNTLKKKKLF